MMGRFSFVQKPLDVQCKISEFWSSNEQKLL